MFVELMPLLKERTLLITIARLEEKQLKVNVIPTKAKEGEDQALTTPLSYTGSPEELDAELGKHLASYVDSHVQPKQEAPAPVPSTAETPSLFAPQPTCAEPPAQTAGEEGRRNSTS